jgi:dipeptidyl aminopeptidase/acylaminoacyl peptidase
VLLLGLVCSPLAWAEAPSWKWTAEAVVDTLNVTDAIVSPDGGSVVFVRSRWRPESAKPGPAYQNLWRVPFAGGSVQRLTTADADDQRPRWSPDGSRIAFLSKRAGGDTPKTQVFLLPAAGGEAEAVSSDKVDVTAFEWSPDGRAIAYLAQDSKGDEREKAEKAGKDAMLVDRDLRPRRLWVLDVATRHAEAVASLGELSAWDFDWKPDGSALVASVTDRNRTDDSYSAKRIAVLPLHGERQDLVGMVGKVGALAWSKDGRQIAYLAAVDASDPSTGSLFVVPAAGGPAVNLTRGREESAQAVSWRRDGRLAVVCGVGTGSAIYAVDPARGAWDVLLAPGAAAFGTATWSADATRYAFVASTADHPSDVYAGTLVGFSRPAQAAPKRIAESNPQLDGLPRGPQQTVRYKAKDGLEVEGVVIKPVGFRDGVRYPLVVIVHGGPEAFENDGWHNSYSNPGHALAERGYVVLLPNYRGSTGRGVAYAKGDHRDLGGKEFSDVLDGVDRLVSLGWVDPARVGITGGSYGGYFTALGVTRFSDRFAAGVELFGISNWESFMGQSDIPGENALVHWDLWCYEHAALCRERSAVGNLEKAKTPTLILQGKEDERVPKPQSDELYAALSWKKVPVEYVVYPREPHGFRERWHRIDAFERLVGWMDKYLAPR